MKILLIHNSYQQHGGEDVVFHREKELLQAHGHDVMTYQVENEAVPDSRFVQLGMAGRSIWNPTSFRELRKCAKAFQPAVAHFHNTLAKISPAGYQAVRGAGAAAVQTLHNFRYMCPAGTLYRNGAVCQDCVGRHFQTPAVRHGCYRSNKAATAVLAASRIFHDAIGTYSNRVDAYITLTEFSKNLYLESGLPKERLYVKPNFVDESPVKFDGDYTTTNRPEKPFALYVGRLVQEKGIRTLLKCWTDHEPGLAIKIIGEGPLKNEVIAAAQTAGDRIEYQGQLPGSRVRELMEKAALLVFPSEWYETFGLSMIEAFAAGKPVVASRMGTMQSIVKDEVTGRLFAPGNAQDMAKAVRSIIQCDVTRVAMGAAARKEWREQYAPEGNYRQLIKIYASALSQRHGGGRNV
jgi:glycosyltransferase involved in cell wall biosynthesis